MSLHTSLTTCTRTALAGAAADSIHACELCMAKVRWQDPLRSGPIQPVVYTPGPGVPGEIDHFPPPVQHHLPANRHNGKTRGLDVSPKAFSTATPLRLGNRSFARRSDVRLWRLLRRNETGSHHKDTRAARQKKTRRRSNDRSAFCMMQL